MPYPQAAEEDVAFFRAHGWLIVRNAVDQVDVARVAALCDEILENPGITCWMPFHDVDEQNGCMHFVDGGHLDGVLEHRRPDHVQSDLLCCEVDEARAVACPLSLGDVTFHHGRTPHMTPANVTGEWRRALTQHLYPPGCAGEGDHYPWKIYVNQFNGKVTVPETR